MSAGGATPLSHTYFQNVMHIVFSTKERRMALERALLSVFRPARACAHAVGAASGRLEWAAAPAKALAELLALFGRHLLPALGHALPHSPPRIGAMSRHARPKPPNRIRQRASSPRACQKVICRHPNNAGSSQFHKCITTSPPIQMKSAIPSDAAEQSKHPFSFSCCVPHFFINSS